MWYILKKRVLCFHKYAPAWTILGTRCLQVGPRSVPQRQSQENIVSQSFHLPSFQRWPAYRKSSSTLFLYNSWDAQLLCVVFGTTICIPRSVLHCRTCPDSLSLAVDIRFVNPIVPGSNAPTLNPFNSLPRRIQLILWYLIAKSCMEMKGER